MFNLRDRKTSQPFNIIETILSKISGIVLVILSMAGTRAISQTKRIISTREGLPQSFVSGLQQDQTGFVWIGTRNGLARYDGLNFKVFQHKSSDTSSLASDLIINIKGFNNSIWIEHESGEIDRLDPVSENQALFFSCKIQLRRFFSSGLDCRFPGNDLAHC